MELERPASIYDHVQTSDFLLATFERMKQKNPAYSMRAWARSLKAKNPTTLFRVMRNERKLPKGMMLEIGAYLKFNSIEMAYFELISAGAERFSEESFQILREALKKMDSPSV